MMQQNEVTWSPDDAAAAAAAADHPDGQVAVRSGRELARRAQRIAADAGLTEVAQALHGQVVERSRAGTRVVACGEFNRGKSTLVNQLLGRDLLPTGAVPVTRGIVTVTPTEPPTSERLDVHWPDGHNDSRRLDDDPWRDLVLDHDPTTFVVAEGEHGPPEPELRLQLDDAWLRDNEIELVDTPGTNEGRVDRILQTRRAVAVSDVAVLTLSAGSPLSLTERSLLEDELIGRHVPHVVVVVTMLDTIETAADRDEVMASTERRVHRVSPGIAVLPGPGLQLPGAPTGTASDAPNDEWDERLTTIRRSIEERAAASGRTARRDQRLLLQVADACRVVLAAAAAARDQASRAATDADAALKQAKVAVDRAGVEWDQVRLDLDARRLGRFGRFRERVQAKTDELYEGFGLDLHRSPDPKGWWEHDLPLRLRRELRMMVQGFESALSAAVDEDAVWLDEQVKERFGLRAGGVSSASLNDEAVVAQGFDHLDLDDLQRKRTLNRAMVAIGGIIGATIAFVSGVGMPVAFTLGGSAIAGIVGERALAEATAAQRALVDRHLRRVVDDIAGQFLARLDGELTSAYEHMLDELRRLQHAWMAAELHGRETAAGDGDAPGRHHIDWTQVATAAQQVLALALDPEGGPS
jgi:hypothetical protein